MAAGPSGTNNVAFGVVYEIDDNIKIGKLRGIIITKGFPRLNRGRPLY